MPAGYYVLQAPEWLRRGIRQLPPAAQSEIVAFAGECRPRGRFTASTDTILRSFFPAETGPEDGRLGLRTLLSENGFDPELHEQVRADLGPAGSDWPKTACPPIP